MSPLEDPQVDRFKNALGFDALHAINILTGTQRHDSVELGMGGIANTRGTRKVRAMPNSEMSCDFESCDPFRSSRNLKRVGIANYAG